MGALASFFRKRPDIGHDEFHEYWIETHAELVLRQESTRWHEIEALAEVYRAVIGTYFDRA